MTEERYSLKDDLFNEKTVKKLTDAIKNVYGLFDDINFFNEVISHMPPLELKERVTLIRTTLEKYMPSDYMTTTQLFLESLKTLNGGGDFVFASYCEYVEIHGCTDELVDYSLEMLGEYTKWFSSEFSIRKFINNYPDKTYEMMHKWSLSEDVDQRRFASEGLRPKLPWASKINFDYKVGIKPLNNLYYDNNRYVVRSVANHLNDISKLDPDLVVDILKEWQDSKKQEPAEMDYLTHHALRTSIKKGHVKSLNLIGYQQNPKITLINFKIIKSDILIGDSLEFSFDITAVEEEALMVDFKVHYPMANAKTSEKVFKMKKINLKKGETAHLKKAHPFRRMTTKKLYTGDYKLSIQINGKVYSELPFKIAVD